MTKPMTTKSMALKSMTTTLRTLLPLLLLAAMAHAQTDAQKAFATIKNMPGTWEQKAPDGKVLQVTFKVVSGGSAVMSEIMGMGPEDMITMFHLDGPNKLLMTHYCGVGNQPRMQASVSPDGKTMTFNFQDATNLGRARRRPHAEHGPHPPRRQPPQRRMDLPRPRQRDEGSLRPAPYDVGMAPLHFALSS